MCMDKIQNDVVEGKPNCDDIEGEELQILVDNFVRKSLKDPDAFWSKTIKSINTKFQKLYEKLRSSSVDW